MNLLERARLGEDLPLRKVLVTTDVSSFAGLTTFARLGMAILLSVTEEGVSVQDITYLRRGGPPPGPAIEKKLIKKMKKEDDEA